MKPIETKIQKTEYKCPICNKTSEYKDTIVKCIQGHQDDDLTTECKGLGSQAYFTNEKQANRYIKMKENQINAIYFIPMSLSDDYTAKLEWSGPGLYNYTTKRISEGLEYDSYEILFKKIRS